MLATMATIMALCTSDLRVKRAMFAHDSLVLHDQEETLPRMMSQESCTSETGSVGDCKAAHHAYNMEL